MDKASTLAAVITALADHAWAKARHLHESLDGTSSLDGTPSSDTSRVDADGLGVDRLGNDGLGVDGLGVDGLGNDGLGVDGLGNDGLGNDGLGVDRLDVDRLDAIEAAGRLNALVVAMLGADPALEQLARENSPDVDHPTVSPRTSRRIILALEEALDGDPLFAADLAAMVAGLRPTPQPAVQPLPLKGPAFANSGIIQGGVRQNGGRW